MLLLSRAFSPQNLIYHMSEYVQKELGKYYDQSHVTSIEEVLSSCVYNVPLLFVLSTGVDPTNNILNYCNLKAVALETISLGQGQGKKAEALIERSQSDGTWVLLNNCHLSKSWLGDLEKLIAKFSEETITNKNFRLILSSMPVNYFPSNILQNADKITLEPPRGIKPNISRSFK
jgi:dynein heavy chain